MAKAEIIYKVTLDTNRLEKDIKKIKRNVTVSLFLVRLAKLLSNSKKSVEIEMEQIK